MCWAAVSQPLSRSPSEAVSFCSSPGFTSFVQLVVVHSSEVFVYVYLSHQLWIQMPTWGLAFYDNVFIFSQWPEEPPSNQHSWEAQGFHLSCLLILRIPAKCSLLWRAMFACRRECKAKRFINSVAPVTASGPSPPALRSSYEGKGLHSTEPAPSTVDQEPFSHLHTFACQEDRIHASSHTHVSPSRLTLIMSRTAIPGKPFQPQDTFAHSSCAPTLDSSDRWSVSSTKLADFSRCSA